MLRKLIMFYGRFLPSFTAIGYHARLIGLRSLPKHAFTGQTWLVTGATGGIGKAVAIGAAERGARVYAVGRSEAGLAGLNHPNITPLRFDLDRISENVALAREIKALHLKLDVLVNNVGRLEHIWKASPDGFESTYALNLLGHFALTEALIEEGALDGGMIINMASGGLYNAPLSLRLLEQTPERYSGVMAYAAHKRAQLALASRWTIPERGIISFTMHPGWVRTDGVRTALPELDTKLGPILRSPEQGADTALWLAHAKPPVKGGALWFDRAPRAAHVYAETRIPEVGPDAIFGKLKGDVEKVIGTVT